MKFHIGDTAEYSKTISDADVRKFADLTGDYNPVHLEEDYARETLIKGEATVLIPKERI